MIDKIKKFEEIARELDVPSEKRTVYRDQMVALTESFLDELPNMKAFVPDLKSSKLVDSPISDDSMPMEDVLALLKETVIEPGLNPASGGHLGYIPGGGIFSAALGDYAAAITNRYAGVFFTGPGAVRMENMLLNWMAEIIGYPKNSAGNLTSGGSIANLIGIVTARDAHGLKARDFERSVIYMTNQVHHSIEKSISIAGLKEAENRFINVDSKFRMDVDHLERSIEEDKANGLNPFAIIASAGTTDVGAVDPLEGIGDLAKHYGIWYHVDAAYGGFFCMVDEVKGLLKGQKKSDSIVMDPHKGLFLPYGSGAVLVKDSQKLYNSHNYFANYMQDTQKSTEEYSPADLSPELTKHFRGLRQWLPLKLHGLTPFKAALSEKILLARYFYEKIQTLDGFEVGHEPDLSVVLFRYIPKHGDANEFNEKLVDEVQKDGTVFLSSTTLNGIFYIRVAVLCFRSHLDIIDLAIEKLLEKVKIISKN